MTDSNAVGLNSMRLRHGRDFVRAVIAFVKFAASGKVQAYNGMRACVKERDLV